MRSSRAAREGSRRMISAICEFKLCSELTRSLKARLILWSEPSFGHESIRRRITSSGNGEWLTGDAVWVVAKSIEEPKGRAGACVAISPAANNRRDAWGLEVECRFNR